MAKVKPEMLRRLFRENLRRVRIEVGLTQKQLAEAIGTQQPYIAAIESGSGCPTLDTIAKLANALKVSPRDLMPHEKVPETA